MVRHFTWDDRKEAANVKKHGVTFAEASTVLMDPLYHEAPDPGHGGRWIAVGMSARERVLLVVYFEVNNDTVRILSARPATNSERKQYEEGI